MAGEWRESTVGKEAEILLGFAFKSAEFATNPPGHRLVRGDNVKRGTLEWGEKARFWRNLTPDLEKYRLREGDIVIGMDGSRVGENFARVSVEDLPAFLVQRVACLRGKKNLEQVFLRYLICNPAFTAYIKAVHTGTSIPHISGGQIGSYPILVPPLDEQRVIAHILGTLDDKIELNRRMNETLEAMARALFKSWFVDFDPARAKAEGRDPGLPKPLADMFPYSVEDSLLGEIPKGWEVGTLADFAFLNPESWSTKTRPEVINYVDLSNTKWGSIETVTDYAQQDAPSRAQRVLRSGDTIVGTVRPGNGSYAFISADGLTGSTGFAVLRPRRPEYAQFVYLGATASENIETLSHLADGGAYPAVRPEVVIATQVIRPSDKILARFSMLCAPLLEKIAQNERESCTLAAQRDALLPKLISGELRIEEDTHILERVS